MSITRYPDAAANRVASVSARIPPAAPREVLRAGSVMSGLVIGHAEGGR